jgi:hypothetical protein
MFTDLKESQSINEKSWDELKTKHKVLEKDLKFYSIGNSILTAIIILQVIGIVYLF